MSLKTRKEPLYRINLILNSFIFIISACLFLEKGNLLYAGIIFFTGLFYLISLRLASVSNMVTELSLYILNMIVALITALDFFSHGSHYIQYVWIGVTIVYFIFSIRQFMHMVRIRYEKPAYANAGNAGVKTKSSGESKIYSLKNPRAYYGIIIWSTEVKFLSSLRLNPDLYVNLFNAGEIFPCRA